MKQNLVPIFVKLFRKPNGHADWPDFNRLPSEVLKGMKWSQYIDVVGAAWHYDKVDNLGTGHDHGTAFTLVPEDFAVAARDQFPDLVSIGSETEAKQFWESKVTVNQDTEFIDTEVLQGIKARMDMETAGQMAPPSPEIVSARERAFDPNDEKPGIRKNKMKKWPDALGKMRVTIHPNYRRP